MRNSQFHDTGGDDLSTSTFPKKREIFCLAICPPLSISPPRGASASWGRASVHEKLCNLTQNMEALKKRTIKSSFKGFWRLLQLRFLFDHVGSRWWTWVGRCSRSSSSSRCCSGGQMVEAFPPNLCHLPSGAVVPFNTTHFSPGRTARFPTVVSSSSKMCTFMFQI